MSVPPNSYNPDPDYTPSLEDVPRYPPFDRGLPFVTVDQLLSSQGKLVDRVGETGLPYAEQAVRNLAAYVHLLPATSNDFFCGAGGLLRLCLETGFHSFVAAQGNIFTAHDPAEKRRELEAKWQLAAFLAGLCCDLSRAIVTSVVTNDHGEQWLPFEPITSWLARTKTQRYFLRPPQSPALANHDTAHLSGVIVNAVIPSEALQHITTDDRNILMSMLSTITRITDTYNSGQFPKTVRHIRAQVIERDKETNPLTFGKPLVGVHLEPYLVNGMRQLVRDGSWKINQKLARVHVAPDGAYIFWATGVKDLVQFLRSEGTAGVPGDPRTLGELLMREKVFEANPDGGGLWHYIRTPHSATCYEVVKLSNASIILDDDTLASIALYPSPIAVSQTEWRASQPEQPAERSGPVRNGPPAASGGQLVVRQVDTSDELEPPVTAAGDAPLSKSTPDYRRALELTAPRVAPPAEAPAEAEGKSGSAKGGKGATEKRGKNKPKSKDSPSISPTVVAPHDLDQSTASSDESDDLSRLLAESSGPPAVSSVEVPDPVVKLKARAPLMADIRRLLDEHSRGSSPMTWCDHGFAIPLNYLSQKVSHLPFVNALAESGAIYVPAGETNRFVNVQIGDQKVKCVCLLPLVAKALGFADAAVGGGGGGGGGGGRNDEDDFHAAEEF